MFNLADKISQDYFNKYYKEFINVNCHICNNDKFELDYTMKKPGNY